MSAADRRQIQEALRRLDYYRGRADGIFGPRTRAAIRRFQQAIGAETTGTLTADQANRLVTRDDYWLCPSLREVMTGQSILAIGIESLWSGS
jgi:peptidoglycan hydrolase-like protein with peptidoglycan-binding domain